METATMPFRKRVVEHLKWRATSYRKDVISQIKGFALRKIQSQHLLPEIGLSWITGKVAEDIHVEPLIMDDMCMPPHHQPSYEYTRDHDDVMPLMQIASALQPRIMLELGTAHGSTTANLCRQCPGAKVYTLNAPVEEQTGDIITYSLTRDEIGRVYRQYWYTERVVQIYANTLHMKLGDYFEMPVIDLAVIDACHDTDYVLNDFKKVLPFMKPGGIIVLHDTHPSMFRHLAGSYRACMQLRREGFDIRHLENTWWGVWKNEPLSTPQNLK